MLLSAFLAESPECATEWYLLNTAKVKVRHFLQDTEVSDDRGMPTSDSQPGENPSETEQGP